MFASQGVNAFAHMLARNRTLTTVDLEKNNLGSQGASILLNSMAESCSPVTHLSLARNGMGPAVGTALFRVLTIGADSLTAITAGAGEALSGPHAAQIAATLGFKATTPVATPLSARMAAASASLATLRQAISARQLAATHADRSASLQSLQLQGNAIAAGAVTFVPALATNATLRALNLADNDIGDAGACALAQALHTNHTLTTLQLNNNRISAVGARELAAALTGPVPLQSLYLAKNAIFNDGAVAFAEVLTSPRPLLVLDLSHCKIGDDGAIAMVAAIGQFGLRQLSRYERDQEEQRVHRAAHGGFVDDSKTSLFEGLRDLRLRGNFFSNAMGAVVVQHLTHSQALLACDFHNNRFDIGHINALAGICARNKRAQTDEEPRKMQNEILHLQSQQFRLRDAEDELALHDSVITR